MLIYEPHIASVNLFLVRYDVVINADQPVGNYWLYVAGLGFGTMRGLYETAILRYDGAPDAKPDTQPSYEVGTVPGKVGAIV